MRYFYTFAALLVLFGLAPQAFAAQISLDPEETVHNQLDTFYVPVRIDTEGTCINAVDVGIIYDPERITVQDISTGSSILTLFAEQPTIQRDENGEVGRVSFAGGVPGGYCGRVEGDPGRTDILVQLVVAGVPHALSLGEATTTALFIEPYSAVYNNDGEATKAPLTVSGTEITLMQKDTSPSNVWLEDVQNDEISPEFFEITLVKGPSAGHQRHYIAFSTTDKQSGLDHYEVLETDPDRFGFLSWVSREAYWARVDSPYVLRDQYLRSKIMVRAFDKNGNYRTAEYTPPMSPLVEITRLSLLVPIVTILLVALLAFVFIRRRMRARRTQERESESPTVDENEEDQSSNIHHEE